MIGNYGFIHDKLDIKILILFILRRLPEPVTFDTLTELAMCDDGISYFDYADCVAELVKTEHVLHGDNKYSLTGKGARNSEITENNLPFSVRAEAEKLTAAYRATFSRNAMIQTSHESDQNIGLKVALSLSDGVGEIVSINLFAANEQQALALEDGFRKNAENVYSTLIKMILE